MRIGIVTDGVRGAGTDFFRQIERADRTNYYYRISKSQPKPVSFRAWFKDLLLARPTGLDIDLIHQASPTLAVKFAGPTIVSAQEFEAGPIKAPIYKQIVSWSYRAADLVIVHSEYQKQELMKRYGLDERRFWIVSPAVDDNFSPVLDSDELMMIRSKYKIGSRFAIAIGDEELIMPVFKRIKAKFRSPLKLVLVGPGDSGSTDVIFTKPQDSDLPALYSAASFALAAGSSPSCQQILEMMRVGLPVITTNSGCRPEHGDEGLITESITDWPKSALNLLVDKGFYRQMSMKAQKQARKASWDKAIKQTVRAYELVAQKTLLRKSFKLA